MSDNEFEASDLGEAREIITLARSQIGVSDDPPDSHRNKYTAWYGSNTGWAAIFISWLFTGYGKPNLVLQTSSITDQGKWFQNRERWGDRPRSGAVAYFDPGGSGTTFSHTGIVEFVRSETSFTTIEGDSNGAVRRVERNLTDVNGFGYPVYPVIVPLTSAVSLGALVNAAQSGTVPDGAEIHVQTVQVALGKEGLLADQNVSDGYFGPETTRAYAEWQRRCGFSGGGADGVPGEASLKKLADRYGFTVAD